MDETHRKVAGTWIAFFEQLPRDIVWEITAYLPLEDYLNLRLVGNFEHNIVELLTFSRLVMR